MSTSQKRAISRIINGKRYVTRFTPNRLLTCPEVAVYRGWSVRWVYELLRRGKLKALRMKGRRMIAARQVIGLRQTRNRLNQNGPTSISQLKGGESKCRQKRN